MWLQTRSAKQNMKSPAAAKKKEFIANSQAPSLVFAPFMVPAVRTDNTVPGENSRSECPESDGQQNCMVTYNAEESGLAVSDYPSCGYRLLINDRGDRVGIPQDQIQPLPIWDVHRTPVCVLRVKVISADRICGLEVKALFSVEAQITSVSETLAQKLGFQKKGVVICSGLGCEGSKAYLPSRPVDISCLDVVHNHTESQIPKSTRMALLIVPDAGNDLVLGLDWYKKTKAGFYGVLDFATDQGRIHFLPKGKDVRDKRALHGFGTAPLSYSNYIEASWDRPDPGPNYNADPDHIDNSHRICPDTQGQSYLATIAAAMLAVV